MSGLGDCSTGSNTWQQAAPKAFFYPHPQFRHTSVDIYLCDSFSAFMDIAGFLPIIYPNFCFCCVELEKNGWIRGISCFRL